MLLPDTPEMTLEQDISEDPYVTFELRNTEFDPEMTPQEYSPDEYLVVMPSVREIPWEYFEPLKDMNIFVCDDSDGKIKRPKPHNQWGEMFYPVPNSRKAIPFKSVFFANREFTTSCVGVDNLWLFPNHNPSVKNIGLYYAAKEGYKAVILLDDDCDCRERHANDFMTIKRSTNTWDWNGHDHNWVNTLSLITKPNDQCKMFARGFPYEYRTTGYSLKKNDGLSYPYFNEGMWVGHPDINGIDKLEMMSRGMPGWARIGAIEGDTISEDEHLLPWYIDPETKIKPGTVLLRSEQSLPLSIMNCQIDASLIPAFYQPADYPMSCGFKIRRHDDVWSMYFLRKIMSHLDLGVTVGKPLINHQKQANVMGETLSEHHTNLIQPHLTYMIDEAVDQVYHKYYGENGNSISTNMVALMADELSAMLRVYGDWGVVPGEFRKVLHDYFAKTQGWAKLFL